MRYGVYDKLESIIASVVRVSKTVTIPSNDNEVGVSDDTLLP